MGRHQRQIGGLIGSVLPLNRGADDAFTIWSHQEDLKTLMNHNTYHAIHQNKVVDQLALLDDSQSMALWHLYNRQHSLDNTWTSILIIYTMSRKWLFIAFIIVPKLLSANVDTYQQMITIRNNF